jgi:23S rRNA pseudouridine2604 synthase
VGAKTLDAQLTIMMHKPVGFVSAQPEGDQIPAVRLMTRPNRWGQSNVVPKRGLKLAPLGRLDQDSRGLLLLSEDGVLAKAIIGPQSGMEKEYLVEVAGQITPKKLALLRHGLMLDGRQLLPAIVEQIGPQRLRFILREGRNRQIRRMAEAVELAVVDLLRIRIGPISLGDLPEGRWRPISADERARLLKG